MSEEPRVLATLKAGTTIVLQRVDGLVVKHPDDPPMLVRWDGTREILDPNDLLGLRSPPTVTQKNHSV